MTPKIKDYIGIQEAMENLAVIVGIDLSNPPPLGFPQKNRFSTDAEELKLTQSEWLDQEGEETVLEVLDVTYLSIYQHLKTIYEEPTSSKEDKKKKKGILSLMALVGESAQKIQSYLALRLGHVFKEVITERESFLLLHHFYTSHFPTEGSLAEASSSKTHSLPVSQDLETLKRDQEYELFTIQNEEGEPYFQADMIRNLKLNCDFGGVEGAFEEDPLLKVRAMQDRDLYASAGQILGESHSLLTEFYKIYPKIQEMDLAKVLSMAGMSLLLAGNSRHLMQNGSSKSCLQYFEDFHTFLRRALKTSTYQKLIAYPPDKSDKISQLLLYVTHQLCKSFFTKFGGVKQEVIGLIHRTMRKGEEIKQRGRKAVLKGETLWNQFLLEDEKMRTLLDLFPNGPLFKILDFIRETQDPTLLCFDPIGQKNFPYTLYSFQMQDKKIPVLRLPSPTRQSFIHKAEIVEEFRGFLRALSTSQVDRKVLLVNLQDRNSWKEKARSQALESLQKNAEFSAYLRVLTLAKKGPFYHQTQEFLESQKAPVFIQSFLDSLSQSEEGEFSLPLTQKELAAFAPKALHLIHRCFFEGKNTLTRANREDFIEIFYQLLILKCLEVIKPDLVGFCCKDGVDIGPAAQGMLFAFVKILKDDFTKKETHDLFRWLVYAPALLVRERAIDPERFHRMLSALETVAGALEENGKAVHKELQSLYDARFWKSFDLS